MQGKCLLCEIESDLQLSHVVPNFVIKWMKRTSPSFLRSNRNPNVRLQDGEKRYMLCWPCEQLLSGWEEEFCQNIFVPYHQSTAIVKKIAYGPWALKFCVSMSLRVLGYFRSIGISEWSAEQETAATKAMKVWRDFLLGKTPHPADFEQHLLPVDVIESGAVPRMSPYFNRYLVRCVHIDGLYSKNTAMVFAKLCRLLIFGFVHCGNPGIWKGTKVHVKHGLIQPTQYEVPGSILIYLNEKAGQVAEVMASISPRQKRKCKEYVMKNLDKFAESDVFRAMSYDVRHSGKAAFTVTNPQNRIDSKCDEEA